MNFKHPAFGLFLLSVGILFGVLVGEILLSKFK